MTSTRLAVIDTGQVNERILNKDEYRADFRKVEGASLKRTTHLSSPHAKRMFARCFYSFQASMYFISQLGRAKLDHEVVERIEQNIREALDAATDEINKAIDQAEALLKHHNIETLASYDTVPLQEEIGITSSFGRRYFDLMHKLDIIMPMMETLAIEEIISERELETRRSLYKRIVLSISTKARNLWMSGLMWGYGALAIYPHLKEVAQIAYPMLLAGSAGVAALYAPLAGRAYLYMIVPQVASLVIAHLAFDGLRSIGLAAIVAGFGFTMHRSAQLSKAAGERLARALLERDRLRADHARLAELELTEAKLAAESARNEAAATRDLFIAKVSHEFRTPLQTIVALADLLALKTADERSKGLQEPVQRLSRAADQLMHQANDLAAFVRANQAAGYEIRERPVRLDEVVAASITELRELANRRGVDVRVTVPAISLHADDMRLQQIIGNLVSNAVKYTSHGHIEIHADVDGDGPHTMTLWVSDTGSGIAEEVLPNVFDPWFRGTREARGLGLGLSIVRSLVAQLGGTAEIKSEKGQGTRATVHIPVKVLDQQPTRPLAGSASLSGLHVLVVDDEDSVRSAVADLLRAKGAECVEAPGTDEALQELGSKAFEVALVDIQMPGADGYELARRLRARSPGCDTRLIAMSAFGLAEQHGHLFDAYVAKPSKADKMVGTIIQTLARDRPAAANAAPTSNSGGASSSR